MHPSINLLFDYFLNATIQIKKLKHLLIGQIIQNVP